MSDTLLKAVRLIHSVIKSEEMNEATKDELIAINITLKDIAEEIR